MQHVIIVIHLMLVLALIGVVLLQRSEGGGLGIGSTGGFMTSRGTANVLTRATAILAGLFFLTSLLLSILAGVGHKPTSILEGGQSAPTAPGAPPPLGGAAAACSTSCKAARRRLRRRRQQPRRGRRCRSRSEITTKGPGNPAPSTFGSGVSEKSWGKFEESMQIVSQVPAKLISYPATHRCRAGLSNSRSSNRFARVKG